MIFVPGIGFFFVYLKYLYPPFLTVYPDGINTPRSNVLVPALEDIFTCTETHPVRSMSSR